MENKNCGNCYNGINTLCRDNGEVDVKNYRILEDRSGLCDSYINNEKISVLIPVYNRKVFLPRAILSILNQTYQNFEILIYDDGSSDGTFEIAENFTNSDNRIKLYFGRKNQGIGYARNQLLKICRTKYAIWMDSDDISHPERIELQLKEMTEDKLVFCTWEDLAKKKAGTTKGFASLLFPVRKDITFDETMMFGGEDWDWIERMREIYPETLVKKVLYSIDFHGNRIGTWKRKIDKEWKGEYNLEDIKHLSYEEVINKYKEEYEKYLKPVEIVAGRMC